MKSSESASVNEDIYDFENMQVKATSASQIEKEKQKLQQLYVQREAIIARSKNTQRTISSEGSKQIRRAGTVSYTHRQRQMCIRDRASTTWSG